MGGRFDDSFPACAFFFFFNWRSTRAHQFHFLGQEQSTVAQRVVMTVAEYSSDKAEYSFHASPTARNSALLISAFSVRSTSFFPNHLLSESLKANNQTIMPNYQSTVRLSNTFQSKTRSSVQVPNTPQSNSNYQSLLKHSNNLKSNKLVKLSIYKPTVLKKILSINVVKLSDNYIFGQTTNHRTNVLSNFQSADQVS